MSRWFVHVNTNPDRKHITIHKETNGPCGDIFKNIKTGGRYNGSYPIQVLQDGTIKTGERDNSYWLIVLGESPEQFKDNASLRAAIRDVGENPQVCSRCA
jgi:hypothetical protein